MDVMGVFLAAKQRRIAGVYRDVKKPCKAPAARDENGAADGGNVSAGAIALSLGVWEETRGAATTMRPRARLYYVARSHNNSDDERGQHGFIPRKNVKRD
jgi:hypothetical protein